MHPWLASKHLGFSIRAFFCFAIVLLQSDMTSKASWEDLSKSQGEPEWRQKARVNQREGGKREGGMEAGGRREVTGIMRNTCVRWSLPHSRGVRHQRRERGRENTGSPARRASDTFIMLAGRPVPRFVAVERRWLWRREANEGERQGRMRKKQSP